ncbi:MAG: crossover junction endodeoxyribonuclease RuvC [Desulfobulbaceae bacterium]|nr:crossover junction endodeoxyribonuclease RuvC [Desulfobulbaceae bacterium]HIJ78885.1 crossover junction endodeoxyribonuclease RuvC [Deltaproteobacteria bacterium]
MVAGNFKSGRSLRVLGIDPGSRATGYGVIDKVGNAITFVTCGVIRTSPQKEFPARLKEIYDGISEVIDKYQPGQAGIEDIFTAINPRSALKLGHARGVLILAAMQHGLPVREYTPSVVKQAVAGYGQAPKEQVQQMVRILLQLNASPSHDAADALAVAICHANHHNHLR